ncbi:MAG: sulfatase-like hydrolase/transferase [Caulobacterales bacterium]|nr:sulfatase-like hydrolase/transferase [Caulobacterales bacterium]
MRAGPIATLVAPALLLVALALLFLPMAALAAPRPNVVLIMVDDLGWPDVSTYGLRRVATPNLDRIAAQGVAFSNAYVAGPVCAVSRAGLLTGRSPQRFGFEYNLDDVHNFEDGLPVDQPTIADRLRGLGYHTGLVGKWHQGYTAPYYPIRRGFDEFFGFLAGETIYVDPATPGMVTTPTKADRPIGARKPQQEIVEGPDGRVVRNFDKYLTGELTDRAVQYIDANSKAQTPFFLYLAYNAPHWPMQVPKAYYDRFSDIQDPVRRTYVAMIAAMDDGVGRVLDALQRDGVAKDTLVIFLSDNGCPIQFGFCDCGHPLGAGKFTQLEGGVRVPFMMSWPGAIKPAGIVDTPVSSLDIAPTILKAAGAEVGPLGLDGRDLLSAGGGGRTPDERPLFWRQDPVASVRMGRWKLWTSKDEKATRLYDLTTDPGETTDVSAQHADVVRALSGRLAQWEAGLAKPRWPVHRVADVQVCGRVTESVY